MRSVCAWCGTPLPDVVAVDGVGRNDPNLVSHGICDTCLLDLEYRRQPLPSFLNGLTAPVMAVDGDGRLIDSNPQFLQLVGKSGPDVLARLGGDVISCIYAPLPGGCGQTVHCVGCTIRGAVTRTQESGNAQIRIPAFAYVRTPDGQMVKLLLRISTERVGGMVLLRVDEAATAAPDGAAIE